MPGYKMINATVDSQRAIKELNALSDDLQRKAVRSGLVAAVKPVKKDMADLAPDEFGSLSESIGHISLSKSAKSRVGVDAESTALLVGPTKKVMEAKMVNGKIVSRQRYQGYKANWFEEGVKPHIIKAKKGGVLRSVADKIWAKEVKHPGIRATHFMARALSGNNSTIPDRFFRRLETILSKSR